MKKENRFSIKNTVALLDNLKHLRKIKKIILIFSVVCIVLATLSGINFVIKVKQAQSLQYCQDYNLEKSGIMGNVDIQEYVDIHKDFDIGANQCGYPVFKKPEKALQTLKRLYPDVIALIQSEFDLDDLTADTCQQYKIYSAQIAIETPREQEQARFISRFLDIYENSYFKQ